MSGEMVGSWDGEAEVVADEIVEGPEEEAARADLGDLRDPAPDPDDEPALNESAPRESAPSESALGESASGESASGESAPGEFGGPGVGMSGAGPHTADRVSIDEEQA
jgi:hypothetical protein